MPKYMPGPWKTFIDFDEVPPQIVVIAERNDSPEWVCSCGANQLSVCRKNARLIAAAPELLQALETTLRYLDHPETKAIPFAYPISTVIEHARTAIAKAKGETNGN